MGRMLDHRRGAGCRRNAAMVALGADRVLGFVLDTSPGSTHTLELAAAAGLDVRAHHTTSRPAHPADQAKDIDT